MATDIEREVGQFPLSIGTSLAVEGLLGVHPNQQKQPPGHGRIKEVWFNLRTLVRNFYAAMPSETALKVKPERAVPYILQEIEALPVIAQQAHQRKFVPRVYFNSLEREVHDFPHAIRKQPKTERQQAFFILESTLLKQTLDYVDAHHRDWVIPIRTNRPPATPTVVALLTHFPHELLWRFEFETLFLLESHTGKLKSYSQWTTKLHGVKVDDHIPFNKLTIQLFGDGHFFEGYPKPLRDELKQIAATRRWTAVTTLEKVMDDILHYGGETLKATCRQLC